MRLGLIARADDRGLGAQTLEVYRHMAPAKTLVIDASAHSPYEQRFERFPDGVVAKWDAGIADERLLRWFAADLDVIYTAETFYDARLIEIAAATGVRTVVHVNPEFFTWAANPSLPAPSCFALPSTWRRAEIEAVAAERGVQVLDLPMPVDRERFPPRRIEAVSTLLHVGGHPAMHDRNGTVDLLACLKFLRSPMRLVMRAQRAVGQPSPHEPRARHVKVEMAIGDVVDNATLYDDGDLFVFPRKFGGLCLPMREAMSRGLPVITTDLAPQSEWVPAEGRVRVHPAGDFKTQGGWLPLHRVDPRELAAKIDEVVEDPAMAQRLAKASDDFAESISWANLRATWEAVLAG